MNAWTKVFVGHPQLGLVAFALVLVFGLVYLFARAKRDIVPAWLSKFAATMAFLALVGGLLLEYVRISKSSVPAVVHQQSIGEINQESGGAHSVNAAGVQGNVTVNNGETGRGSANGKRKDGE